MVPEQATRLAEQPANRIALAIADPFVMTVPIAVPGHQPLEVDGTAYSGGATVAEIVRAVPIVQPVHAERTLAS